MGFNTVVRISLYKYLKTVTGREAEDIIFDVERNEKRRDLLKRFLAQKRTLYEYLML